MNSINSNSNRIPGMRQPTQEEHSRIVEAWKGDYDRTKQIKTGNVFRFIGFVLCAMAVTNLMSANFTPMVLTGFTAVASFLIGNSLGGKAKYEINRMRKLEDGRYLVVPAFATKAWTTSGPKNALRGFCEVRLNDGKMLPDICRIPTQEAKRLRSNYIKSCPILLVQIEGENELIALPAGVLREL